MTTWRRLTRVDSAVTDPEQREMARLVTGINAGLFVVGVFAVVSALLDPTLTLTGLHAVVYAGVLLLLGVGVLLGRRGHYHRALAITLGVVTGGIYTLVLAGQTSVVSYLLYFLVIPMLLTAAVLTTRLMLLLAGLFLLSFFLLPHLADHLTFDDMPVVFTITFAVIVKTARDHVLRVQAARSADLAASERRYRTLFSTIHDPVVLHDNGVIIAANDAFCRFSGYSADEVVGLDLLTLVEPGYLDAVKRSLALPETPGYMEIVVTTRDGQRRSIEVRGKTYLETDYPLRLTTFRDLADRKLAEQHRVDLRVERERALLLQRFVSDVSHDLRTPLSVILSSSHLLGRVNDTERQAKYLARLQEQAEHMREMVENLLQVSRLEQATHDAFVLQPNDLGALACAVKEQLAALALLRGVTFICDVADDVPLVLIDADEMRRAIHQLLMNAISYTPQGGTVTLRLAHHDDGVTLAVIDTGVGIPAADLPHIFDLFYRVDKARGTEHGSMGLGLFIVRSIIDAHGGTIQVRSVQQNGSTFTITLPSAQKAAAILTNPVTTTDAASSDPSAPPSPQ